MIKVYGHPLSVCTRIVLTTLVETNTPYELIAIDFAKGEHKEEPYLSRQPFGVVPAIEDDGFPLYESRAIARYVNDKAHGTLVPTDLHARARMEQWISVESFNFAGPSMTFILHHVFQLRQSDEALAAARKQLETTLDVINAQLGRLPYFAGMELSLADIFLMPYVEYVQTTPLKEALRARAELSAWWQRVSERPSWRKVTGRA